MRSVKCRFWSLDGQFSDLSYSRYGMNYLEGLKDKDLLCLFRKWVALFHGYEVELINLHPAQETYSCVALTASSVILDQLNEAEGKLMHKLQLFYIVCNDICCVYSDDYIIVMFCDVIRTSVFRRQI